MHRSSSPAASPEVLRVSDSSPSSAESSFRELDDVFLQTQTRIWLGEVLHTRFDEEATIADLLANGEILFQVSKVVWKMLRTKYIELKCSKAFVYKQNESGKGGGRYTPYSNVDSFLKICQIMGLTGVDLFSPSDVVEKRDTRRVCMCIRSLSKKARLKHLNVPDFDIVTYTIAMPTDMVGWIRRTLEQSQCSSSRPLMCSRCLHSKAKYRQAGHVSHFKKSQGVDLLAEDSDDAERCYQTPEFHSPASDTSFDSEIFSGLLRDSTPGGDSMVEDDCQTPEHIFHSDIHNQHVVSNSSHYVPIHLAESAESWSAGGIQYGNYQFTSEYPVSSSKLCLEHQIGSNVTASCSHRTSFNCLINNTENGCHGDCECCGKFATSVENSPNELDELSLFDSREADKGKICNDSILQYQSLTSHLPNQSTLDSHANSSDVHEESTNSSFVPLHPMLQSSYFTEDIDNDRPDCNFMVKEKLNAGCSFTLQKNKAKSACSKIWNLHARACEGRVEDNYSLTLEGTKGCMDFNPSSLCANYSVLRNTFPMCFSQHQSSTVYSNNDKSFKGNCILPDRESAQGISKYARSDGLDSICRALQYEYDKFVDGNGDANSCLFNCILSEAAAVDCEVHSYEKLNPAVVGVHTFTLQNSRETDQLNYAREVMFSKDSANAFKVRHHIPFDLVATNMNEKHQNLSPQKKCNLADMDPTSDSLQQAQIVVESGTPEDQESSIAVTQNCHLSDIYSMNLPQECSTSLQTNIPVTLPESIVINVNGGAFSGEQLEDGPPVGPSNCCSNESSPQNDLFRSLNERVSNGSDSCGVCSERLLSHDICPATGCQHLPVTLRGAVSFDNGNSKNTIHAFSAQELHGIKVKNQECVDLTASENELMANGGLLPAIKTEKYDLESEVEVYVDLGKVCLGIPLMDNGDQNMHKKAAFESGYALEVIFADESIHCNHVSSSTSKQIEGLSLPTPRTQPCPISENFENEKAETQNIGVKEDSSWHCLDKSHIQGPGLNFSPEKNVAANVSMDTGAEEKENKKSGTCTGQKSGPSKKILLKSVAGGMTLFGALFILFHIRNGRGEEKVSAKKVMERHKMNVRPKVLKPKQDKNSPGNRSTAYPGDRLKFKD